MMKINLLKKEAKNDIKKARDLKELDEVFRKYLGKRGKITLLLRDLKNLSQKKRAKKGRELNLSKGFIEKEIEKKAEKLREKAQIEVLREEKIDVTAPGKKVFSGHLHPLTLVKRKVEEIFQSIGFSVVEGPEIETEWYNFDALNIPAEHPARDFWDTLWLKPRNQKLLLRTHTSPVQVRYMEKNNPPLRIIVPGRVFRHEATDASHEINFYQVEGLMAGKDISAANFKGIVQEFFQRFFGKKVEIRLRPSYFPFTEPSFEVDMTCLACDGKGCSICSKTGWLEMIGAGMVHPNVLKNSGLISHHQTGSGWQGFAFGMGLERLAMMKYKINDIRLFYSGDLRFLKQF